MLLLLLHTDPSGATAAAPAAVDNVAASILSHLLPFLLAPLVGERSCSVSKHMLLLLLLLLLVLLLVLVVHTGQRLTFQGQGHLAGCMVILYTMNFVFVVLR